MTVHIMGILHNQQEVTEDLVVVLLVIVMEVLELAELAQLVKDITAEEVADSIIQVGAAVLVEKDSTQLINQTVVLV